MWNGLKAFEKLLNVFVDAFHASVQGNGVAVAFEEVGGLGGVEGVLGAFTGAVDDGGLAGGDFLRQFGGALPVHVAVNQVVKLSGDEGIVDGEGECVGDVLDVGDLAALVGVDGAAFFGGFHEVVPL